MSELKYLPLNNEKFQSEPVAVIDADSFAWAIGWIHRESYLESTITNAVDEVVSNILIGVRAHHYIGILSPNPLTYINTPEEQGVEFDIRESIPNFRNKIAVTSPYKGNRKEKPEWYPKMQTIIEGHLRNKWGFIQSPEGYEADDFVSTICHYLRDHGISYVCCGNDKDLLQIPGKHFNFVKKIVQTLTQSEADYNLWKQVLMGDATDGVPGIPGYGPKTAEKQLESAPANYEGLHYTCLLAYINHYGSVDTAIQKFYETYMLVKLRHNISLENLDATESFRYYDLFTADRNIDTSKILEEQEDIPNFSDNE